MKRETKTPDLKSKFPSSVLEKFSMVNCTVNLIIEIGEGKWREKRWAATDPTNSTDDSLIRTNHSLLS